MSTVDTSSHWHCPRLIWIYLCCISAVLPMATAQQSQVGSADISGVFYVGVAGILAYLCFFVHVIFAYQFGAVETTKVRKKGSVVSTVVSVHSQIEEKRNKRSTFNNFTTPVQLMQARQASSGPSAPTTVLVAMASRNQPPPARFNRRSTFQGGNASMVFKKLLTDGQLHSATVSNPSKKKSAMDPIVVGGLSLNSREQSSSSPSNSKQTDIIAPIIHVTSPNMATSTSALATAFVLTLQQASGPSASLSSVQIEAQLKTSGVSGQSKSAWAGSKNFNSSSTVPLIDHTVVDIGGVQLAQLDDDRMKRRLTYKQVVVVWVCVVLAFGMVVSTAMMHTVSPSLSGVSGIFVILFWVLSIAAWVTFLRKNTDAKNVEIKKKGNKFVQLNPPQRYLIDPGTLKDWMDVGPAAWRPEISAALGSFCAVEKNVEQHDAPLWVVRISKPTSDCCIISNYPLPAPQEERYFEVTILQIDMTKYCTVAIGLSCAPYPHWRMPGCHATSVALTNDGFVVHDSEKPDKNYSATFGLGDTIGVLHHRDTGNVSFSLNGVLLAVAAQLPPSVDLFPAVGSDGECAFSINFGTRAFLSQSFTYLKHGLGRNIPGKIGSTLEVPKPAAGRRIVASPTLSAVSEHEGSKRSNDSVLIAIEKLGEPRPTVLRDYAPAILKVPTSFTGARRRTMDSHSTLPLIKEALLGDGAAGILSLVPKLNSEPRVEQPMLLPTLGSQPLVSPRRESLNTNSHTIRGGPLVLPALTSGPAQSYFARGNLSAQPSPRLMGNASTTVLPALSPRGFNSSNNIPMFTTTTSATALADATSL